MRRPRLSYSAKARVQGHRHVKDTEIELQHIFLEASAQRWQHLERFFFSYYCFREGFVGKNGKPDWQIAKKKAPHSQDLFHRHSAVLEPLVPHKVIIGAIKKMQRDNCLTTSSLGQCLDSLLKYAVISQQEKNQLKRAGLKDCMPATWYTSKNKVATSRFTEGNIRL